MSFRLKCKLWIGSEIMLKRIAIALFALLMSMSAFATPGYTLTDIGNMGGGPGAAIYPYDINNAGQVAGSGQSQTNWAAFCYSGGSISALATPPGLPSYAVGINAAGEVAGAIGLQGSYQATIWNGGVATNLGALGGSWAFAIDINDSGQMTGAIGVAGSNTAHAFLYSNGVTTDLGTLGGDFSQGRAINNSGQVVGDSNNAEVSGGRAFLYSGGIMTELIIPGSQGSQAEDINDSGQVVGYANINGNNVAFLWSNDLTSVLSNLAGSPGSAAYGINNAGEVVGQSQGDSSRFNHAIVWVDGTAYDLNNLLESSAAGWTLEGASAINDLGQITAWGVDPEGVRHAFILTPIPEPTTLALLGLGLAGLVASRRRKQ